MRPERPCPRGGATTMSLSNAAPGTSSDWGADWPEARVATKAGEVLTTKAGEVLAPKVAELRRQLDGIGLCAEETAGAVLGSVEAMMRLNGQAGSGGGPGGPAQDHLLTILSACGFQDIIGQRLSAAREAIGSIERRLDALEASAGDGPRLGTPSGEAEMRAELRRVELMLNGPQAPAEALSQADIDALFG